MNRAEQYRSSRPSDGWLNVRDWLEFIRNLDAAAVVSTTDLGIIITFSDGSIHRMK